MNSIDINPSNNPSNKDVVLLLCTHIRDEEREISSKSGTKKVIYSVWKCPNHNCVTEGEIKFLKQSGFTNAFNHLMRCIGKAMRNRFTPPIIKTSQQSPTTCNRTRRKKSY